MQLWGSVFMLGLVLLVGGGIKLVSKIGLVAFGENIATIRTLTREFERFHDELGRLDANERRTKLYDALFEAAILLNEAADALPADAKPAKRIFVLTDGQDK